MAAPRQSLYPSAFDSTPNPLRHSSRSHPRRPRTTSWEQSYRVILPPEGSTGRVYIRSYRPPPPRPHQGPPSVSYSSTEHSYSDGATHHTDANGEFHTANGGRDTHRGTVTSSSSSTLEITELGLNVQDAECPPRTLTSLQFRMGSSRGSTYNPAVNSRQTVGPLTSVEEVWWQDRASVNLSLPQTETFQPTPKPPVRQQQRQGPTTNVRPDRVASLANVQGATDKLPAIPNIGVRHLQRERERVLLRYPSRLRRKSSPIRIIVNATERITCWGHPTFRRDTTNFNLQRYSRQSMHTSDYNNRHRMNGFPSHVHTMSQNSAQDTVDSASSVTNRGFTTISGRITTNSETSPTSTQNVLSTLVGEVHGEDNHVQPPQASGDEEPSLSQNQKCMMDEAPEWNGQAVLQQECSSSLVSVVSALSDSSITRFASRQRTSLGDWASVSAEEGERAVLEQYIDDVELSLSFSTFWRIGAILAASQTLRVINLKSCTIENDGLYGLAEIRSLRVVCVSHTRQLTSLLPLVMRNDGTMSSIRAIDAQCTSIGNDGIAGIGNMSCLEILNLSKTYVTNVTSLAVSRSLIELNLAATHVTSEGIAGLEMIPTLTILNISRTRVGSLHLLSRSTSLEDLNLYSCAVGDADVRGVELMPQLRVLDVSTTKITDLSFLSVSTSLNSITAQWLAMKNCMNVFTGRCSRRSGNAYANFLANGADDEEGEEREEDAEVEGEEEEEENDESSDNSSSEGEGSVRQQVLVGRKCDNSTGGDPEAGFSGLASIPTLEHVDLSYTSIRSVQSLFASSSIKSLILRRTRVDSEGFRGVQKLHSLETVVITNTLEFPCLDGVHPSYPSGGILDSIADIASVASLVVLDLSSTNVQDVRMLSVLQHLRELYLVETLVTDEGMCGIERLPSLRILDVSQTGILSLQFLISGCPVLETIRVKASRFTRGFCIGHLYALPALVSLDVSDTVVEDIQVLLRPFCRLKQLIWRWGERRNDAGCIDPLPCWVKSSVLRGLENLPQLEYLDLTKTAVDSVSFLSESKSLKQLILSRCTELGNTGILGLERIPTLESLDLTCASRITEISSLAASTSLCELLVGWTGVTSEGIKGISNIPTLRVLNVISTPAEAHVKGMMDDSTDVFSRDTRMVLSSQLSDSRSSEWPPAQRHRRVSFL